jgi:hypothetical protein
LAKNTKHAAPHYAAFPPITSSPSSPNIPQYSVVVVVNIIIAIISSIITLSWPLATIIVSQQKSYKLLSPKYNAGLGHGELN